MNPTLTQIVQNISAKVPQNEQQMFQKWCIAGQKIMFDPKMHQNMQLVKDPAARQNPVPTIAQGTAGLIWIMYSQAGKPKLTNELVQVMGFAAIVLMCHAIDFAEQSLKIQFTPQMISECTKWLVQHLFERVGVGPQQLQDMIDKNAQGNQAASGDSAQQPQNVAPQQGGMLAGAQ